MQRETAQENNAPVARASSTDAMEVAKRNAQLDPSQRSAKQSGLQELFSLPGVVAYKDGADTYIAYYCKDSKCSFDNIETDRFMSLKALATDAMASMKADGLLGSNLYHSGVGHPMAKEVAQLMASQFGGTVL